MKITVTQQHIDEGIRGSATRDPVAFAMADAGCLHPYAGISRLFWYDSENRKHAANITETLYEFIRAFDQGEHVEPFEFEVECGN